MQLGNKSLGATLLLAGTCIGAGMLALPVTSAASGFTYSVILLLVSWLFMYLTGLYVVEVCLATNDNPSYITMAHNTLGEFGRFIGWFGFLLLFYSLLAAYITGGGDIIADASQRCFHIKLPYGLGPLLWGGAFALVVFLGVSFTDGLNRILMVGLVIAYACLLTIAAPNLAIKHLVNSGESKYILAALPIVFTGLGYHIILPSMYRYLDHDVNVLRKIILIGSLLPLFIYIIWEGIVFGIIPIQGEHGLIAILRGGHAAVDLISSLDYVLHNIWLDIVARFFIFFAIASSFIGVAYGLFDLIADGLHLQKTRSSRVLALLLTFIPPLIFAFTYPKGFVLALSYAGLFVAIVHGLLPVLMVWSKRFYLNKVTGYQVWGGKLLLLTTALFFIAVIFCEIAADFHWIPTVS